jgi:ribosomal protein S18 acetylase RimI-like enzyme
MVDPSFLDELAVNATAATSVEVVDGWVMRAAPDLPFRRANCAFARPGAGPLPLVVIEDFYAAHHLPARVQVPTVADAIVDESLAAHGYEIEAPVDVLIARASDMPAPATVAVAVTIGEPVAQLDDDDRALAYVRMYRNVHPRAISAVAVLDDRPAGEAFAVVDDEWCGIFGMRTRPDARRRGVASALLHTIATEAPNLYLQVERDNDAARALYVRAGFTYAYGYHYRVKR